MNSHSRWQSTTGSSVHSRATNSWNNAPMLSSSPSQMTMDLSTRPRVPHRQKSGHRRRRQKTRCHRQRKDDTNDLEGLTTSRADGPSSDCLSQVVVDCEFPTHTRDQGGIDSTVASPTKIIRDELPCDCCSGSESVLVLTSSAPRRMPNRQKSFKGGMSISMAAKAAVKAASRTGTPIDSSFFTKQLSDPSLLPPSSHHRNNTPPRRQCSDLSGLSASVSQIDTPSSHDKKLQPPRRQGSNVSQLDTPSPGDDQRRRRPISPMPLASTATRAMAVASNPIGIRVRHMKRSKFRRQQSLPVGGLRHQHQPKVMNDSSISDLSVDLDTSANTAGSARSRLRKQKSLSSLPTGTICKRMPPMPLRQLSQHSLKSSSNHSAVSAARFHRQISLPTNTELLRKRGEQEQRLHLSLEERPQLPQRYPSEMTLSSIASVLETSEKDVESQELVIASTTTTTGSRPVPVVSDTCRRPPLPKQKSEPTARLMRRLHLESTGGAKMVVTKPLVLRSTRPMLRRGISSGITSQRTI